MILPISPRLTFIKRRYNELLESTWARSKRLGKLKSKGFFKREQSMVKQQDSEQLELKMLDLERTMYYLNEVKPRL
jgi:hypothetical protein